MTLENNPGRIIAELPAHENPPEGQNQQAVQVYNPEPGIDNQGNPIVVPVYHTPGDPNGPNQGQ